MILDYQTPTSLQASIENNPVDYVVSSLSKVDINILYQLFSYDAIYDEIFFARETVAKKLGISVCTFSRRTNLLHDQGFIIKSRPQGKPFDVCHYKLTEETIAQKKRIMCLYKYFKGLGFALGILVSTPQVQDSIAPLYSYREFNLLKTTPETNGSALRSAWQQTKRQEPTKHESHTTKKEEKVMKQEWVTPTIQSATGILGLSKWGQIRLSAYSPKAIEYAVHSFKKSRTEKSDPFGWVIKVCNEWCRKNNTAPDWDLMHDLAQEHRMPPNPELIVTNKSSPETAPFKQPTQIQKTTNTSGLSQAFLDYGPIIRAESRRKNEEWASKLTTDEIERRRSQFAIAFIDSFGAPTNLVEKIYTKPVTEIKEKIVLPQNEEIGQLGDDVPLDQIGEYEEIY